MELPPWKRAVLKVGSALMAPEGKRVTNTYTLDIAGFITQCRDHGREIILVSSGAVAAGISTQTGKTRRPLTIREKQALAAIGQPLLMTHWSKFFDFPCAQLLLTYDDIKERKRLVNAKNTLTELLTRRTLPIINENDTTVVDELKVGDNDNLAAHVAVLADADMLFIATDIDGLYDADPKRFPQARLIPVVEKVDHSVFELAGGKGSLYSVGGMITKLQAAEKATSRGINTVIFNGARRDSFEKLLHQHCCGTLFKRASLPLNAKKHWMLHAVKSRGVLTVDAGAHQALIAKGASLLPSGITSIEGHFKQGDSVDIRTQSNEIFAKGLCQYDAEDLGKIIGKKSGEIEKILGYVAADEVVHRDDLVLLE
ncbi:MAG: glutamate 5-kinase [Calditrichaeota bacterium]|nr:MAG: glutamate 5-kinase [Calditrichota bacterium]